MGRTTYESIGRPLPQRHNIVLTRDESRDDPRVTVINDYNLLLASSRGRVESTKHITSTRHLPYNPDNVNKAKALRQNMTEAEKKLRYTYMKPSNQHHRSPRSQQASTTPLVQGGQDEQSESGGIKYLRQQPILDYIVDFYCPKLRLVIEIDGDTHYQA